MCIRDRYVVLEGEPGHQDSIIRTENAVDTLKNNGIELEKLSYGIANWNRAQAQNRMMQMLSLIHISAHAEYVRVAASDV